MRVPSVWTVAILWMLGVASAGPFAQQASPGTPPPAVSDLIRLLEEPAVKAWLAEAKAENAPAVPPSASTEVAVSAGLAERVSRVRNHLRSVASAIPRLPEEAARAYGMLHQDMEGRGLFGTILLFLIFVAFGYGSEFLFWRATARTRAWIGSHPMATVPQRLHVIGLRLAFGLALVAVFGLGSIGAILPVDWPLLFKQLVLGYLLAVLILRFVVILGRVFLVPGGHGLDEPDKYRVVPMSIERARYWHLRLALFVGYFAFGWMTVGLLAPLGFSPEVRIAAAYLLGLGLLGIALEAVWRRPRVQTDAHARLGRTALSIVLTAYGVILWLMWVAGVSGLFWLAVVALLLPKAIAVGQSAVTHLLRPTDSAEMLSMRRGVLEVCLERGFRALLIVAAALWLADAWHVDLVALTDQDTLWTRLLRGALTGIVVVLVANLLWQVIRAAVDAKLAETEELEEAGSEQAVRQARLRTLLPIFRNILFVVIAIIAGLTALSSLGIEIGPLIAGVGVAGVAVGFGAQTIVRDVISDIFYLLDDAFRVGEYIQSGSYKGTVESFSLRSVKLRHHRGPVYTVPFGQLGAVQNMSRDWVIGKFVINLAFDTDLEKARKLIKKIGQDLAADPEFSRNIIEPLKMQGVEQSGDFAIQIRCKLTTKPGEQFTIRRKAYALIKQAFAENDIKLAFPTVQVAGGGEAAPAMAHEGLQLVKPADAAE